MSLENRLTTHISPLTTQKELFNGSIHMIGFDTPMTAAVAKVVLSFNNRWDMFYCCWLW